MLTDGTFVDALQYLNVLSFNPGFYNTNWRTFLPGSTRCHLLGCMRLLCGISVGRNSSVSYLNFQNMVAQYISTSTTPIYGSINSNADNNTNSSTSQLEGVLGQPHFFSDSPYNASASTFYSITDMQYDCKTQRLYIVDNKNNRVVTGISDEGSSGLAIIYNNVTRRNTTD